MLTYRYTWEGSRMIVWEYEGGRRGHRYEGRFASNGIGVTLFPVKGGYDPDNSEPYTKKHTNIFKLIRLPDYASPSPAPIESARADTRKDKPEEPEVLDNSAHTGVQIKLII